MQQGTSNLSPDGRWRWDGSQWVAAAADPVPDRATLSPDGQWRWDGSRWVAAAPQAPAPAPASPDRQWAQGPAPAPAPASAPTTLSPDGQWRWDGSQWVPTGAPAPQTFGGPAQAGVLACQVCGGQPAAEVTFRQHMGFILYWMNRRYRVVCCRDCGLALFRRRQNLTLLTGWWGLASVLLMNWITIVWNLVARGTVTALPAPNRPGGAAPLDPGRPVFLRPGMIVACLAGLFVIAVIVLAALPSG